MGLGYESILNQILFEIEKKNISVVAIVCREQDRYCLSKDRFPVITKKELDIASFDYVIVSAAAYFKEIKKEIIELGISGNKVIEGGVFNIPLFDFSLYISLIENPITILSDDCWSGYVYHYLRLPFYTPLINIRWDIEQYTRFIQNPLFYLKSELQMVRDSDLRKGIYPIGRLGDENDYVTLNLVHNINFEEAKEQWNRRLPRMNEDNLFIKMGFAQDINMDIIQCALEAFENVKDKKILFYYDENSTINGAFQTKRFIWKQKSGGIVDHYHYNDYLRGEYFWDLDILKLLTGKGIYSRYGVNG